MEDKVRYLGTVLQVVLFLQFVLLLCIAIVGSQVQDLQSRGVGICTPQISQALR